jgi:hypothetical protein
MQAYAAPYITPISKIISDDEGELLGTGSYVEMIGRRLLITNEHNVAILQTNSLATGCEFFIRTDWKSRLSE